MSFVNRRLDWTPNCRAQSLRETNLSNRTCRRHKFMRYRCSSMHSRMIFNHILNTAEICYSAEDACLIPSCSSTHRLTVPASDFFVSVKKVSFLCGVDNERTTLKENRFGNCTKRWTKSDVIQRGIIFCSGLIKSLHKSALFVQLFLSC